MGINERNEILRAAAGKFLPDLPVSVQAAGLAVELGRYAGSAWIRRDRLRLENPYAEDSLRGLFWRALRSHPFPASERSLRQIIASGDPQAGQSN